MKGCIKLCCVCDRGVKYLGKAVVCLAAGGLFSCTPIPQKRSHVVYSTPPPPPIMERAAAIPPQTDVTLAWDASPSPSVVSYNIYTGFETGSYSSVTNVGNVVSAKIYGLSFGVEHFFVATAKDEIGVESEYSNEVAYTPTGEHIISIKALKATSMSGPWMDVTNWPSITVTNPAGNMFYKLAITNWWR